MKVEEKLMLACSDAQTILDSLGIEYGPVTHVECTKRNITSWWGQCIYNRRTSTYSIRINRVLLTDEVGWEQLLNTVIHEYLHAHKDRMSHTGEWKRCANLINCKYPMFNITRCASSDERGVADLIKPESYKYVLKCDGCGTVSKFKRAGKSVKNILIYPKNNPFCKCSICGSNSWTLL